MTYVIGIDQSTQGTKVLLFDQEGKIVKKLSCAHQQIISEQGWVSHNPTEIYDNVINLVDELIRDIDKNKLIAVGITNQRETALAWYKGTGQPIDNAIVWQCARAKAITDQMDVSQASMVKRKTGLPLSPYFSAAKYSWLIKHYQGELDQIACGTVDSWLIYQLTSGKSFKTDVSNASRTQLMNLEKRAWDEELCSLFGIPVSCLPQIEASDANFGETDFDGILPHPVPIHAVMGDSHAALFAHKGFEAGDIKATYGTGSSIMMNIGTEVSIMPENLAVSVGWQSQGTCHYVIEGNINYSGAVMTWLKDSLHLFEDMDELNQLVAEANPLDKTYLVPAFSGLGAPYFRDDVTAAFVGMTRTTGRAELVKAGLESIAYQINAVLSAMKSVSKLEIKRISADGGPTKNAYLMQFQSNLAKADVDVATVEEASCTGVAYLAGISCGAYPETILDQLSSHRMSPEPSFASIRLEKLAGWDQAVNRLTSS
ncbi:glycerol kinase [Streptococcus moroccensis]|uniref:ATP:glycerol 3-phosphotransferase n=2 Tax=Streptococcus moroccensis TaxID=1451356 RepID=A0ABT9YQZ8_9STRE|nr:FGGY family carbohydrate kinase [Streptococcus moroccensis]MDQ0222421.1 glycerol kinase [Streptococcus moroccensis]